MERFTPSPSPRPSPSGRGRIVSQSFDESKRLVCSEVWMRGSLSQRERAGVRENAMLTNTLTSLLNLVPSGDGARPSGRFNVRLQKVWKQSGPLDFITVKRPEGRAPQPEVRA